MKAHLLFAALFLCSLAPVQAQSKSALKAELSRNLEAYKTTVLKADFEHMLNFMPPKFFEKVPRDSMLQILHQTEENDFMKVKMSNMEFTGPNKIKKAGIYSWTRVEYKINMHFMLKGDTPGSNLPMIRETLESVFGEKNVSVEGESTLLVFLKDQYLIAFRDPKASTWYFMEDKSGETDSLDKELMTHAIPQELLEALTKK